MSENCLFCKIAADQIPSKKVYEDEDFLAFHDINPAAPIHILVIPKKHVVSMQDVSGQDSEWLGKMMALAPSLAAKAGCRPGPEGGRDRLRHSSGQATGREGDADPHRTRHPRQRQHVVLLG